jgi:GxxExxY protein
MTQLGNIDELTHAIIGCAMEVHQVLGPGFSESVYQNSLALELSSKQLTFEQYIKLKVSYKSRNVGDFEADMIVENRVLLELKALSTILPQHEAQLVNYLRATGIETGLLFNFGHQTLQVKRKFAQYRPPSSPSCES